MYLSQTIPMALWLRVMFLKVASNSSLAYWQGSFPSKLFQLVESRNRIRAGRLQLILEILNKIPLALSSESKCLRIYISDKNLKGAFKTLCSTIHYNNYTTVYFHQIWLSIYLSIYPIRWYKQLCLSFLTSHKYYKQYILGMIKSSHLKNVNEY